MRKEAATPNRCGNGVEAAFGIELPVLRVVEDVESGGPQGHGRGEDDGGPVKGSQNADPCGGRGDCQGPAEEEAGGPRKPFGEGVEDEVGRSDGG